MRQIVKEMRQLTVMSEEELFAAAKNHQAPYELIRMVAKTGKLPVPNFSAGGIATPADAALMRQLGAEAVFVGSGIFMKGGAVALDLYVKAERAEAESRAQAIVKAATHFDDPKVLAEVSEQMTGAMQGLAGPARHRRTRSATDARMVKGRYSLFALYSGAASAAPFV